ncbi:44082_t:CDS:2, partial [Gigaspora margarita]
LSKISQMKTSKDNQITIAENKFNIAKRQYFDAIDNLFKIASASEDLIKAFEVLQRIQNEDINKARKLIEEASNLGHTHAKVWLSAYHLTVDFGA